MSSHDCDSCTPSLSLCNLHDSDICLFMFLLVLIDLRSDSVMVSSVGVVVAR